MRHAALILLACAPASVQAHTFGQPYTLPVPFWLYAWGAAGALILSFLAAGYGLAGGGVAPVPGSRARPGWIERSRGLGLGPICRALALFLLALTIATGFFGRTDPYRNFSMTAFWTYFVLGLTYFTAVAGNVYALANPWRTLADGIARIRPAFGRGRWRYPERLGAAPALALYYAFIAWELLAFHRPLSLAIVLSAYTALNLLGVWAFGVQAWFRHGELFAVLLRLVGRLAPLHIDRAADGRPELATRAPLAGTLQERPADLATVALILFMLAATAFDGLHATRAWSGLFWHDPLGIVTALSGSRPFDAFVELRPWYTAWQAFALSLALALYVLAYVLALAMARALTRSTRPLAELARDFAFTLLPIVLAYHFTHYFTVMLGQAPKIVSLASDPFGWDWNLFGTRELWRAPLIPDLTWTWHIQVGLIVLGHVASVLLAHRVALRVFPGRARAALSQLPLLLLMVGFTVVGLWILAQPLQATLIRG